MHLQLFNRLRLRYDIQSPEPTFHIYVHDMTALETVGEWDSAEHG